ncbi:MAG: MATE family efflux transporter [Oscillospiraceae bacterium]|nr:MATE family efflux transporter [Oscillospiraceae bacterium]
MIVISKIFDPYKLLGDSEQIGDLPDARTIFKKTVNIAWPAVLESFLISIVAMVDNIMVSSLGTYAIAAVGLTTQPKFVFFALIISMNVALSALVARRRGENDRQGANRVLKQAIVIAVIIIAVISVVSTAFARPLLLFCGAQADTIDPAVEYYRIIMAFSFFQLFSMVLNAAQRGVGRTKIAMRTNIVSNVVNVLFNWLLINGNLGFPALGIKGAAIATVLGSAAACAISVASICNRDGYLNISLMKGKTFDKTTIKSLAKLTGGTLSEQLCFRFGFLMFAMIVANLGTTAYATHQIAMNCMHMSFAFGDGFSVAAVSLVGMNLGAKRSDLAKIYGIACKRLGRIFAIALGTFFVFFGRQIYYLFTDDMEIINLGTIIIGILIIILFFQIDQVITSGCLKGAGDTKYVAKVAFISVAIIRPLSSFLFCYPIGWGLIGAWIGTLCDQLCRNVLNATRFKSGKWSRIKI